MGRNDISRNDISKRIAKARESGDPEMLKAFEKDGLAEV